MRILINCLSFASGGAVAYLRNLLPELLRLAEEQAEHQVAVLVHPHYVPLLAPLRGSRTEIIPGPRVGTAARMLWERVKMQRLVHRLQSEVVFVPYQVAPPLDGVRQVVVLRNLEPFLYRNYSYGIRPAARNRLLRLASVRTLRRAHRVIAVSQYAKQLAESILGLDSGKVRVVYHGRDTTSMDQAGRSDGQRMLESVVSGPCVFSCGSLLPYRRVEDVISAFSRATRALPRDARLVIAGSGSDPRYRAVVARAIQASGVADRIIMLGQIPYETVKALYSRCTLFVTATEVEACPNILIEAMASGCAILAARAPPTPEILGEGGMMFSPRDVDGLAKQMASLFTDYESLAKLHAGALRQAQRYDWGRCAQATLDAITRWN